MVAPGILQRRVSSARGGLGAPGSVNWKCICPAPSLLGVFRHAAQLLAQDFKLFFQTMP